VSRRARAMVVSIAPFFLLLLVWQSVVVLGSYPVYILPSPLMVGETLVALALDGELWDHLGASFIRVALGTTVGVLVGIPLGLAMGISRPAGKFLQPVVTFFQAIPGLAWTPLAILWLGIGYEAVTFIILVSVVFPIVFNTTMGVRSINPNLINAARTLGAKDRHLITEIYIPGALASIVTGLRVGVAYGWRSLVGAEMIAATSGVGYMIFAARQFLRSDVVIVGMVVLGATWLLLDNAILRPLEARTVERWGVVR
jgi:taurine transport system permease protein